MRFAFRPLWQLSAAERAQVALSKAQATAVYAGLQLWPVTTTAALVRSQLMEDGTYPGAEGVLGGEAPTRQAETHPDGVQSEVVDDSPDQRRSSDQQPTSAELSGSEAKSGINAAALPTKMYPIWVHSEAADYSPSQPRDPDGRWTSGGGSAGVPSSGAVPAHVEAPAITLSSAHVGPTTAALSGGASAAPATGNPRAPDGTPIELASLRRKGRAGGVAALLRAAARLVQRLSSHFEADRPEHSTPAARPEGGETTISPSSKAPGENKERGGSAPDAGSPDRTPGAVLRGFAGPKSMRTWQNQMIKRGWTATQVEEAIQGGERSPAENKITPGNGATRFVHPETRRSVVIDNTTGEVIQLGGERFKND